MQVDLSVVKGYRTYILMGANIVCVGLESLGVIPEGTWIKITAILVSLGIVTNRAGSKNDAAAVAQALAAVNQLSQTGSHAQGEESDQDSTVPVAGAPSDPLGDLMAVLSNIVAEYKASQESLQQLGQVLSRISGVITRPDQPRVPTAATEK